MLVLFRQHPGRRFELSFIIVWPFFAIIPASLPYVYYPWDQVYVPLPTGQCFFLNPELIVYTIILWDAFLIVYILFSYLALLIRMYYVSKQVEYTLIIQKSEDRDKLKKFWLTLAMSPLMYWILYICVVVARMMQYLNFPVQLAFVRSAVIVYILVGACYSLWVGWSSEIYVSTYRKLCWVNDTDEDLLKSNR